MTGVAAAGAALSVVVLGDLTAFVDERGRADAVVVGLGSFDTLRP